ncbi:MAG: DUF433 domain-containing protein [Planctomycetota bacterium]
MTQTTMEYVEQTVDGGWRLTDSRVSFDSVIHGYWDGRSPEAIAEEFPSLSVEQVYGAIAYYLRHRAEIDRYLDDQSERWRQLQLDSQTQHGPLLDRIRSSRAPKTPEEIAP